MKKRIAVLTEDIYLYQKIYLLLSDSYECDRISGLRADGYDLCLFDARGGANAPEGAPAVFMSYGNDSGLEIPFSAATLLAIIENSPKVSRLRLGNGCAYIREKAVKLSALEYSLLAVLIEAGGEFITREEILRKVWNSEKEPGIVNVYVHYLREKLEGNGEKIILSSRNGGYRINESFLRKEAEDSPVSN